jgi:predicted transposase YdaD
MRTDTIFYQLFQTVPSVLFELIGESPSMFNSYEFSSKEIKELAFRFDGIYLPIIDDLEKFIYFVEVQFQKQDNFYWDLFGEISLYLKQYRPKHNWRAVAIFAKESFDPGQLVQYQEFFDSGRLSIVYLDKLPESSSSLGLGMIELVLEAEANAGQKARELAQQTKQQVIALESQEKILELIDKILVYKFPQLSRKELERMFSLDDLKKTRYIQDIQQEAKVENAREYILKVVQARFANTPSDVVNTLNLIEDLPSLDGILQTALAAKNITEFRKALKTCIE